MGMNVVVGAGVWVDVDVGVRAGVGVRVLVDVDVTVGAGDGVEVDVRVGTWGPMPGLLVEAGVAVDADAIAGVTAGAARAMEPG